MDEKVLNTVLEEYQKKIDSDRENALEEALKIENLSREKRERTSFSKKSAALRPCLL
jgi:hypothetical protein